MKVPYVGSASGSVLEDQGMKDLREGVSESFTRLEFGNVEKGLLMPITSGDLCDSGSWF